MNAWVAFLIGLLVGVALACAWWWWIGYKADQSRMESDLKAAVQKKPGGGTG